MAKIDAKVLGASGLRMSGSYVLEEWLPQLSGIQGVRTYRQMRDSDPLIGAAFYGIESLIMGVAWQSVPSTHPKARQARGKKRAEAEAQFLDSCLNDMTHGWKAHISEALTQLTYGWAYHEQVWKLRRGWKDDPLLTSSHSDGRIGWAELPLRMQSSLIGWEFDAGGRTIAMKQFTFQKGTALIPTAKAVHYRTNHNGGNPEGKSLLRNAYRSWYYQTKLEEIEAIGVERDLAGIPLIEVPAALLSADATDDEKALLTTFENMGANLRQDEQAYIVMPSEKILTADGKEVSSGYKVSLLSTTSRRQFDTSAIIGRYTSRIAMTLLAEFLLLGSDGSGSWALNDGKLTLFGQAISAVLDGITETFNEQAVRPLMRLNGVPPEFWPTLQHGNVSQQGLEMLADFVQKLVAANALTPDDKLEDFLRTAGKLPERDEQTSRVQPGATPATESSPPAQDGPTPPNEPDSPQPTD